MTTVGSVPLTTRSALLRTKARLDASGLLFLTSDEPRMMLALKSDSPSLQEDVADAIRGAYMVDGHRLEDLRILHADGDDLTWAVTAATFERILQVG